jgi:hypothetical protein
MNPNVERARELIAEAHGLMMGEPADSVAARLLQPTMQEALHRMGDGWRLSFVMNGDSIWWQAREDDGDILIERANLEEVVSIARQLGGVDPIPKPAAASEQPTAVIGATTPAEDPKPAQSATWNPSEGTPTWDLLVLINAVLKRVREGENIQIVETPQGYAIQERS